jgi:stalled ribosome alternative rescue factor ArfA
MDMRYEMRNRDPQVSNLIQVGNLWRQQRLEKRKKGKGKLKIASQQVSNLIQVGNLWRQQHLKK